MKYLLFSLVILLVGCGSQPINKKQVRIPENLMQSCEKIRKFSEHSSSSTIEDHIEYTKYVMAIHSECRVSKNNLIEAVRIEQNTK